MIDARHDRPFAAIWKHVYTRFSQYLSEKSKDIDHHDVITDLAERTELSSSYVSSLILANLIALLGLLTNSVAVVIGAMLISPLMGPIFSLGLAFTMGDLLLTRRSVRNITISILLTVTVAALFTVVSPLKDPTHEILARIRPNVYDLLIAVFAGTAGAFALCTRKNYLFTTTGVAVATAVIPPLSVVGYGIGTWQLSSAAGGFLLFFTNLVAIVISSNTVFYILGFRGSMAAESRYPLRRRFQILGTVLVAISIPLIVTLVTDIRKVKLTTRVEGILKTHLNRQQLSRLTRVAIDSNDGGYTVWASINTRTYVDSKIQKTIEKDLTAHIGKSAKLELEQVIVRSGAVDPTPQTRMIVPPAVPLPETLATLREKTVARLKEGCSDIESYVSPFRVSDCSIVFSDQNRLIGVTVTIARDFSPNAQEVRWLQTALEKTLAEPIALQVVTVPFFPPITFTEKDEIDGASRTALQVLKKIIDQVPTYGLTVEVPHNGHRPNKELVRRIDHLKEFLVKDLKVPVNRISMQQGNDALIRVKIMDQNFQQGHMSAK